MKLCWLGSIWRDMLVLLFAYTVPAAFAIPQQTPSPQEAGQTGVQSSSTSLDDSVRHVQDELRELASAVREMRNEVSLSRAEAAELRRELEETREKLASLEGHTIPRNATSGDSKSGGPSFAAESIVKAQSSGPTRAAEPETEQAQSRIGRLEEDEKLLEGKVDEQEQTKVESGSKNRVRLSGIALLNIFGTHGSVDNFDLPDLALPRSPIVPGGGFGATVRQTQLGLEVFGPTLIGAKTSADIQFDFFGGFPTAPEGVTAGLVRMRTARIHFDWGRTSVVAGQDAPFFSPASPTSLASLGTPALAYAGNLWTWTPQLRIEHRLNLTDGSNILVQAGILDPLTGQSPPFQFYRTPEAGEQSGQPAYAARLAWTQNASGHTLTIGAGGYYARQDWGLGRNIDAWAGTADWELPLGHHLSMSGEFYRGRAIGGLGAGLGRSVLFSGPPSDPTTRVTGLNATGGWSQLKFRPSERIEFNGAFGEDYPFSADLNRFSQAQSYIDASVGRNQSAFINSIFHARSNLLFGLEYRRLWTSEVYPAKSTADHVDVSVGVLF